MSIGLGFYERVVFAMHMCRSLIFISSVAQLEDYWTIRLSLRRAIGIVDNQQQQKTMQGIRTIQSQTRNSPEQVSSVSISLGLTKFIGSNANPFRILVDNMLQYIVGL